MYVCVCVRVCVCKGVRGAWSCLYCACTLAGSVVELLAIPKCVQLIDLPHSSASFDISFFETPLISKKQRHRLNSVTPHKTCRA